MAGRGGRRPGAGRPVGSGKYGEPTQAVRVPKSMVPHLPKMIKNFREEQDPENDDTTNTKNVIPFKRPEKGTSNLVPLYADPATAGWTAELHETIPSEEINLIEYLSSHPDSSFLIPVSGDSMINAGINNGDLLLVDGAQRELVHGRIVVAFHNGTTTVKRLHIGADSTITLRAENPDYAHEDKVIQPVRQEDGAAAEEESQENSCVIQGTVVSVIRSFQR